MRPDRNEVGGVPGSVLGVQPDARSCGACCLVALRALRDPGYAATLGGPGRWARQVLTTHREVTALRDHGRIAVPWPRALGTPPWAVARRLRLLTGRRWRVRTIRLGAGRRREVAAGAADPAVLFVGTRWLPRHVTLVLSADDEGLRIYDPGRGRVAVVRPADGLASATGWSTPWFLVAVRQ